MKLERVVATEQTARRFRTVSFGPVSEADIGPFREAPEFVRSFDGPVVMSQSEVEAVERWLRDPSSYRSGMHVGSDQVEKELGLWERRLRMTSGKMPGWLSRMRSWLASLLQR